MKTLDYSVGLIPHALVLFQAFDLFWHHNAHCVFSFGIAAALWLSYELLKKWQPHNDSAALMCKIADLEGATEVLDGALKDVESKYVDTQKQLQTVMNALQIKRMGM